MRAAAIALAGMLLLAGSVGKAWAATGLDPFIHSATDCDQQCAETYEIKCTQASRYLYVEIGDDWKNRGLSERYADTYTQGQLIGLGPAGLNWEARSTPGYSVPGDAFVLALTRPGSEGTMRAMAVVQAIGSGDRRYAIDAYCWSDVTGGYRNTSLTKMSEY